MCLRRLHKPGSSCIKGAIKSTIACARWFFHVFLFKEKRDRSLTDPPNKRENSQLIRLAQMFFMEKRAVLSLKMADLERSVLLGFCEFLHFFFRNDEFSSRSSKSRRKKARGNVFLTKKIWSKIAKFWVVFLKKNNVNQLLALYGRNRQLGWKQRYPRSQLEKLDGVSKFQPRRWRFGGQLSISTGRP